MNGGAMGMAHPVGQADGGHMNTTRTSPTSVHDQLPDDIRQRERTLRALRRHSYAVLSTVSDAGAPHAAGVAYDMVGTTLYVHTLRGSRKARNVATNERVAIVVPVRRVPFGPPFGVQFQARAQVLAMDDREVHDLLGAGELGTISQHGALEEPDGCFLRIEPRGTFHTYGIGVSVLAVARDPLHVGARSAPVQP